jgi:hypothetical protein
MSYYDYKCSILCLLYFLGLILICFGQLNFVRIKPSIVGLQPAPYDSSTYDGVDQQPELYVYVNTIIQDNQ